MMIYLVIFTKDNEIILHALLQLYFNPFALKHAFKCAPISLTITDTSRKIIYTTTPEVDYSLTLSEMTNFRLFQSERVYRRQFKI